MKKKRLRIVFGESINIIVSFTMKFEYSYYDVYNHTRVRLYSYYNDKHNHLLDAARYVEL